MKKYVLLLLFFILAMSFVHAQDYKISFSYDSAGNQILRDRVCLNCKSSETKTVIDSTTVAQTPKDPSEEQDEGLKDSKLTAYPNPVTDILKVEWVPSENKVKQITLFSIDNRQLFNKAVNGRWNSIDLDFSQYPLGSYIVLIIYDNNTKQSFQVIKK